MFHKPVAHWPPMFVRLTRGVKGWCWSNDTSLSNPTCWGILELWLTWGGAKAWGRIPWLVPMRLAVGRCSWDIFKNRLLKYSSLTYHGPWPAAPIYISGGCLLRGKHQLKPTQQELSLEECRKWVKDFTPLMLHIRNPSQKWVVFMW